MRLYGLKQIGFYFWNRQWALSAASGLLLGLSFPPFNLPFLQFIAFILLFRLAEICRTGRETAYWSYIGFVIWNVIVTYWMMMATVAGGIAAILANSVLMTIPLVIQRHVLKKALHPWLTALLLSSIWIGYEYLHHLWDLAWPWLTLGNGWSNYPSLIQYISYTGYLGISFWIVFGSALIYLFLRRDHSRYMGWSTLFAVTILPLCSVVIDANQPDYSPNLADETANLVIAQPDFNSYQQYYGYTDPLQALDELIVLSDSVRQQDTDAVIWPENAIQPFIANRSMTDTYSGQIRSKLTRVSKRWNDIILTGATYFEYYNPDTLSESRLVRDPESNAPYIYYNSAIGFYPGQSAKIYHKMHLVPLVERIPFLQTLHQIDPFGLPWHTFPWYGRGQQFTLFDVSTGSTPALVCYDSVFPHTVRGFIQRGASFITIITNDGWWGDTSGHLQHFAFARLRAIEFRRWVVRSANNGISGVITPEGSIKRKTPYGVQTAFASSIPIRQEMTFFARHGAWLPVTGLLVVLLFFGYSLSKSLIRRSSD